MLFRAITSRNLANNILRSFLFPLPTPSPMTSYPPPSFFLTHSFSCLSWEICSRNLIYSVAIWIETETTSQLMSSISNYTPSNKEAYTTEPFWHIFFFLWLMSQRTKQFCLTFRVILHRFWFSIARCARAVRKNSMLPYQIFQNASLSKKLLVFCDRAPDGRTK